MFDESLIVQSAVSAFNNAALVGPAFFWWALLAVPLFALVYFCGGAFLQRIGWNKNNIVINASLATVIFTLAWVVLFGGNYAVLRDNATVLPFMIAAIVFIGALFVGSYWRKMNLPVLRNVPRKKKWGIIACWAILLAAIGLSDTHVWWGPILQIGAFVGGILIGRVVRYEMRPVAGTLLIMFATTIAILMQPEFFRFGQLGALTPVHILFLILISIATALTVALRNVNPRGRIKAGMYVKLKWLARIMAVLCMALFVLTESVPVFLGMTGMFFILFALSVWHADSVSDDLAYRIFAITIGLFGIITTLPVLTALGILYWITLPDDNAGWRQLGRML